MDFKLKYVENSDNVYYTELKTHNMEKEKLTPSRAFKKTVNKFNYSYITEAFIPIKFDEIKGQKNYSSFNDKIDDKLNRKIVKGNINIITMFGDKEVNMSTLSNFEDLGLISDYEKKFNDYLVGLPFTMRFYKDFDLSKIYSETTKAYKDFTSISDSKNILGYIPAYSNYSEMEKYFEFYQKNANKTIIGESSMNLIPLMIDFKRSNPDKFIRTISKLYRLKLQYIKEGYYPFYYAMNISKPRLNAGSQLAKEFLLTFLNFDIIGSSITFIPKNGGGGPSNGIDFNINNYKYSKTGNTGDINKIKADIYKKQTEYLNNIYANNQINNELSKRSEANKYIKSLE